jgi:DNA invertase Pin-like site-specific DNA recombinase
MTETIMALPSTQVNPHNSPILPKPPDFQKEDDMSNYVKTSANTTTAIKITALYARLSVGDERHSNEDSNSIVNQKVQLESYAKQHGFVNVRHYTDDDESGRFFDRYGYSQMMADVESGKIGVVIMKDLTRWGRDHVQVGIAMETFRQHGVRFIAVNNGIDSINPESLEFAPFINIMSEWYAKDASKKIKSVFKAKGMSGKRIGSMPPFGYIKCPNNKDLLIIDEPAAEVVRRIFRLSLAGKGPFQICALLSGEKVPIPAYYQAQQGYGLWKNREIKDPYAWNNSTVTSIISKREYCGDTVNFKTRKHIKDKKSHYVDESEWMIFDDTHEPIIDRVIFENVQRVRANNQRRRPNGYGYVHPLSGLLFCADCGGKLYIHRLYNGKDRPTAVCGNYARGYDRVERKRSVVCKTGHRIETANVMQLIRDTLRGIAAYAKADKEAFKKSVQELLASQHTYEIKRQKKRLIKCKSRNAELETLLNKIYEDNALGRLPDNRYQSLLQTYGQEQDELCKEIVTLQSTVENYESGSSRASNFIKLVERYTDFTEISQTMLHEFISKIVVHERDFKGRINSPQTVEIHLNFIGEFIPPFMREQKMLTPEELAEQEEAQQRREKARRSYEKRVESGKQKEYYDRTINKILAKRSAEKESLFDESYVLGADVLASLASSE